MAQPASGDGPTSVDVDAGTRTVYATDNSIYQRPPDGVVVATSPEAVAEFVTANARSLDPRPITARGAGTGTNGQSLTDGLIVDTKRRMGAIGHFDPEARTIEVEPGVVAARLDEFLRPHGLFWPPETSTVTRCTIGGMIATDAAGQGSLRYGRTSRHVVALDVVLDDGSRWDAHPIPVDEAERRAARNGREAKIWRALLDVPDRDFRLPELARGFSGYGLDRVRRDDPELGPVIDPIPVLCGSEGTLGITVGATLALTPIPDHRVLVVAAYNSFDDALDDSLRLRDSAPTSIETIDETTLGRGRASTAWEVVGDLLAPDGGGGSVLLIEYAGNEGDTVAPDVTEVEALIRSGGRATRVTIVDDPSERAAAWRVRADAVGILAKVAPGAPQPTAFVEDCAVPVASMPAFIEGFRQILDAHGLTYGMFGHADVGCVHVRPALDLIEPEHEALVTAITKEVVDLLTLHGGILWGEHGRGLRSQFATDFLDPETVIEMRRIKAAFDPDDRFNPGKLYRPLGTHTPLTTIDDVATRASVNRSVPVEIRRRFQTAFSCNGNGLCHHYSTAEVMCPSFKATGDPRLSPKGRADLLRAWLAGEATGEDHTSEQRAAHELLTEDVADSLDACLSCSACTGRCPVQVDIPELKSRFLEHYHERRRRPVAHRLLSHFESLAARGAVIANRSGSLAAFATRFGERGLGLVDLPVPGGSKPAELPPFDRSDPTDLVLLPDVFTSVFDPGTLKAAAEVLETVGYSVSRARFVPTGKFDHVKGNRRRFRRAAEAQAELIRSVIGTGATPVAVDPAVSLLHGHEYPTILGSYPLGPGRSSVVENLATVLAARADRLPPTPQPKALQLFGHCTERSLASGWVEDWRRVLEAVGHTVTIVDTTCCGMAGIFGHEAANQEISRTLFDLGWRNHLSRSDYTSAATGWSCRSQAERFGFTELAHPVHLLHKR